MDNLFEKEEFKEYFMKGISLKKFIKEEDNDGKKKDELVEKICDLTYYTPYYFSLFKQYMNNDDFSFEKYLNNLDERITIKVKSFLKNLKKHLTPDFLYFFYNFLDIKKPIVPNLD